MKRNKIKTYICHGFNNYFDVPDISSRCRATCRTAVVVKKVDFFDNWKVYDALVWRVIQRVATDLSAEMKIKCPDSKAGFVNSLSQWKRCQEDAAKEDSEFEENTPSEITFLKGGVPICLMMLEDWSDIGKIEPYAASYTYSFYCCDANMDMMISKAIKVQLSEEDEVGEICKYQEAPTPKWYWHLLDLIKGDTFFICAGFIVLALFAIVMIIVSPSPSTYNKMEQSRRFLQKVRIVLLAADKKIMDKPFVEWRMTQGIASTNDSLAVQICKYCKEYLRLSGRKPFITCEIVGSEVLVDPWGNPYNAEILDNLRSDKIRRAFANLNADGIVMWSSGPNGINEGGEGDDIFEQPSSKWRKKGEE